jgi:hypothetical protein
MLIELPLPVAIVEPTAAATPPGDNSASYAAAAAAWPPLPAATVAPPSWAAEVEAALAANEAAAAKVPPDPHFAAAPSPSPATAVPQPGSAAPAATAAALPQPGSAAPAAVAVPPLVAVAAVPAPTPFYDVRKARVVAMVPTNTTALLRFSDEHGNLYDSKGLDPDDFRFLSQSPGLALTAPFLWFARQKQARQPVRPDIMQVGVRVYLPHEVGGGGITEGFAYPIRAPWLTGHVLDLLQPGSVDVNAELEKCVVRVALNRGVPLAPEGLSWYTEVQSGGEWQPLASCLPFPHTVDMVLREDGLRVMRARIHVRLPPMAAAISMADYSAKFGERAGRSQMRGVLGGNELVIRRLARSSAILHGHGFDGIRLDSAQAVYERFRRAAAPAPSSPPHT